MTPDTHHARDVQVDANPDGGFTFSIPAEVGHGIQTLSQAEALQLCGWIIGKAAVRAIEAPASAKPANVDPIARRPGYWTLKAHAVSMPPGMTTPDAVRSELYALGIRFLEGHVARDCITFRSCTMVPVRLPAWLVPEAEDASNG